MGIYRSRMNAQMVIACLLLLYLFLLTYFTTVNNVLIDIVLILISICDAQVQLTCIYINFIILLLISEVFLDIVSVNRFKF
jgi:hypothetical protein